MKIISGGQTGADRGGLDAAIELGIEHGGSCPRGRKAEDGMIPDKYNLTETPSSGYKERTRLNIVDSDATLIFIGDGFNPTGGSRLTANICEKLQKSYAVFNVFTHGTGLAVIQFLKNHKPDTLNIAGNRESKAPGIQEAVKTILVNALRWATVED